jgi:hypothetical protein
MEENRDLRLQINEVISSQRQILRDMLKLDKPQNQPINRSANPVQRKVSTIQSRLREAESADYKEYQERIASEAKEGNAI